MSSKLRRELTFEPGHDCIKYECAFDSPSCSPGKGGSHGVHGLTMRWAVIGEKGAVSFTLYTGWPVDPELYAKNHHGPMPADLGVHAREPRYDGEEPMPGCNYLDGDPCYCDGSGLNAVYPFRALCNAGQEALWEYMEAYYNTAFHDAEMPPVPPYRKPLRSNA